MSVTVRVNPARGVIHVGAPLSLNPVLRSVFGARFDRATRTWIYPATPAAAAALREAVGVEPLAADHHATELLQQYDATRAVAMLRVDETIPLEPLPFPSTIPPWRHQLAAVRFSEPLRASLWSMGMGTGKTRAALDLIRLRGHQRTLVVAPKAVLSAWSNQAALHAPDAVDVMPLSGSTNAKTQAVAGFLARRAKQPNPRPLIVAVNYDSFWREPLLGTLARGGFEFVVFDEIHRLKAPRGRASVAAWKLGRAIPYRIGLTGTLMPHSPLDVYGSVRALDAGVFGTSFFAFRARYGLLGGYQGRQVVGFQNLDDLAKRISPFMFEADRDVLDLPPTKHVELTFTLPNRAREVYEGLRKDLCARLDAGTVTADNALVKLLRMMQVASGHVGLDDDEESPAKERRVETLHTKKQELLHELLEDTDEPIVVFCMFRHDIDQAHAACKAVGVAASELSGRRNDLAAFLAGESRVLIAQMQSGAEGIDGLQHRARYCVFWSLGYSLGRYDQALARVDRPGQRHPVTYYHFIAEGTVDRIVRRALDARRSVVDAVLESIRG